MKKLLFILTVITVCLSCSQNNIPELPDSKITGEYFYIMNDSLTVVDINFNNNTVNVYTNFSLYKGETVHNDSIFVNGNIVYYLYESNPFIVVGNTIKFNNNTIWFRYSDNTLRLDYLDHFIEMEKGSTLLSIIQNDIIYAENCEAFASLVNLMHYVTYFNNYNNNDIISLNRLTCYISGKCIEHIQRYNEKFTNEVKLIHAYLFSQFCKKLPENLADISSSYENYNTYNRFIYYEDIYGNYIPIEIEYASKENITSYIISREYDTVKNILNTNNNKITVDNIIVFYSSTCIFAIDMQKLKCDLTNTKFNINEYEHLLNEEIYYKQGIIYPALKNQYKHHLYEE